MHSNNSGTIAVIQNNMAHYQQRIAQQEERKQQLESKCVSVFGTSDVKQLVERSNELNDLKVELAKFNSEMLAKYLHLSNQLVNGESVEVQSDEDLARGKELYQRVQQLLQPAKSQ